ncbi:MAG TPA: branched-chain amino acid ABC transporter permease/ATP-binding protein [Acidimicrobiales bacterium]|nr:branched-chain amino acid ABC transporter permease/ATP-binding protein [Acidimicrobiales bacterium]
MGTLATGFMSEATVRFAVLGMATGSLYALVALGINLVYRASGILNFAASAIGAISAFLFFTLRDEHGWNWLVALLAALVSGIGLGALTQVLVMQGLRRASLLTKLIATLGLMTAAQGFIDITWTSNKGQVDSFLPTDLVEFTDQIVITKERLVIIGLVVVLATVLRLVYTKTLFGLATSAVAESGRVAAAGGWSPSRIELVNFAVAGLLSAAAAILIAPIVGLNANIISLMIMSALAAALVGRFSSFALTVAAALVIGIIQAELSFFQPDLARWLDVQPNSLGGLPQSVPLLIVIVVTVVSGRARPSRQDMLTRLPMPGTGQVRLPLLGAALVLSTVVVLSVADDWATAFVLSFASGIVILSIVVLTGFAGQLSLCQFALGGFGAWVAGRTVSAHGIPFEWGLVLGIAATVALGLVIALPALRTRGVNLAVVTLGLALMLESIVFFNSSLTGGLEGTKVDTPSFLGLDLDPVGNPGRYALFVLAVFVVLGLMVANVRRGASGRRLLAVRSNERAAASLGVGIYGAKLYAFGLAAGLAATGGILLAFRTTSVDYTGFNVFGSITVVLYAVLGGIGWASGALLGGTMSPGGFNTKVINELFDTVPDINSWMLMVSGVLVISMLRTSPDGLASLQARVYGPLMDRLGRRFRRPAPPLAPPRPRREPVTVAARGVTMRFGGIVALDDVSLTVAPGEVVGLIGPNGAGKTTMLDILTGFTRQTSGEVLVDDRAIDGWTPERRARSGLVRSWQQMELFEEMTVHENLLVAADSQQAGRYFVDLVRPGRRRDTPVMREVIEELGLDQYLEQRPSALPHGAMRLVGIARAMTAEPAALFLDEPAAGLSDRESEELGRAIRRIAARQGIPILVVEHDVPLLMATCDRIVVLDFGRLIAEGTPEEIARHPEVVRAYLGEPMAAEPAVELSVDEIDQEVPVT